MPRNDDAYLLDMLLAARDGVRFATGLTFAQFQGSRLQQYAILKAIEIVGEAAAHISVDTKSSHPGSSLDRDHRYAQPPRARVL